MPKDAKPSKKAMVIGQKVTLRGTARNAKGGAVLLTSNNVPCYIEHLDCWPEDLDGKQIVATGTLREKKLIPDPFIAPDGAISQGAIGDQKVLEDAQWKKA